MPEQLIHHPELLDPITMPPQGHFAMIPMDEYERFKEYGALVDGLTESLEYGRMVGKLEGYQKVLDHVRSSAVLGAGIVSRVGLEEQLERIIRSLREDIERLRPLKPPVPAGADLYEGRPSQGLPVGPRG